MAEKKTKAKAKKVDVSSPESDVIVTTRGLAKVSYEAMEGVSKGTKASVQVVAIV